MKRRTFLKGLLASLCLATAPTIAWVRSKLNIKKVYTKEDFPAPVDGVITLEDNTIYDLQNPINIGNNAITIKGSSALSSITKAHNRS